MPKAKRLWTGFSKGELSPLIEGKPDLAAYFEGAREITNFWLLRQAGLDRRPGTQFVNSAKSAAASTAILLPFIVNRDVSYALEFGPEYIRVYYANGTRVMNGPTQVEIVTPFQEADLPFLHVAQSADVLYLWDGGVHPSQKLSHLSATNWQLNPVSFNPPATYEADTTFSATLVYAATTGTGVRFITSAAVFLAGDVGRAIISGAGWADITAIVSPTEATADIVDAFDASILTVGPGVLTSVGTTVDFSLPHDLAINHYIVIDSGAQLGEIRRVVAVPTTYSVLVDAAWTPDQNGVDWKKQVGVAAGSWGLRLAPQTTLNPDKSKPVGIVVRLTAGAAAFRVEDVGKYITIYGGLLKITEYESTTIVRAKLITKMKDTTESNPPAVDAGSWTLEEVSWSATRGYPRTGGFYQGRLGQGATTSQPTTFWLSESDDFEANALGVNADNALEYTIATRQVNEIQWMVDSSDLFCGTTGSEVRVKGDRNGDPLGGDHPPVVETIGDQGSVPVQPVLVDKQAIFMDRSQRKLFLIGYNLDQDGFIPVELTALAEHIAGTGDTTFRLGAMAFLRHPHPRLVVCRTDGVVIVYTYFPAEKVMGFSTFQMPGGAIESVAVIPTPSGESDRLWMVVARTINGTPTRYIEMCNEEAFNVSDAPLRPWRATMTDCAWIYHGGTPIAQADGFGWLEGETVDVIADGSYLGQQTVIGGSIPPFDEPASVVEIGLHYDSKVRTFRPAIEGSIIEGLPRSWDDLNVRLHNTRGGKVNGEWLSYAPSDLDEVGLFSGDRQITGQGWDTDGSVTIEQTQPYPMMLLALYGTLSIGDKV